VFNGVNCPDTGTLALDTATVLVNIGLPVHDTPA
jgi:hypothetical protein